MADRYIKLDTVLILIETIKEWYKEDPKKHPINYGTMVGMEVGINTGEMFTKQDIVNPYLDKIISEIEQMNNIDYVEPVTVDEVLQIIDKYRAESEEQ